MDFIQSTFLYWSFITGVIVVCLWLMYGVYRSYERKNRIQAWLTWFLLGGFITFVLFVNDLIPGSNAYYDYRYTKSILGEGILLDEIYEYESYVEPLLGDGYSLYVYGISEENGDYFAHPDSTFFDFPFGERANGEQVKNWRGTRSMKEDSIYLSFALGEENHYLPVRKTKLSSVQKLIGALLNEEGNYFAYNAREHSENFVSDITLYVISPKNRWLIAIYSNT
ncbi:MAG: hypothetical protein HWE22_04385 [Flavobacteriales bacterium]|nr:hypothetical protein [Flavobacteriales bacterium]